MQRHGGVVKGGHGWRASVVCVLNFVMTIQVRAPLLLPSKLLTWSKGYLATKVMTEINTTKGHLCMWCYYLLLIIMMSEGL